MNMNISRLLLLILSLASLAFYADQLRQFGFFWDLSVYERAVADVAAGLDPYSTQAKHLFVYHPYVLHAFVALDRMLPLRELLVAGYVAVLVFVARELFLIAGRDVALLALCAAALGGVGVVAGITGNVTVYLHLLVLGLVLTRARTGKMVPVFVLWGLLVLVSVLKPYFLAYAALFLLLMPPGQGVLVGACGVGLFALIWLSGQWYLPVEYSRFLESLKTQTLLGNDMGYAVFGVVRNVLHADKLAAVLHGAVALCLLWLAAFLLPRRLGFSQNLVSRLLILVPVLILLNPRMKEYDFVVAVLCLMLFLYRQLGASTTWSLLLLGFLPGLVPVAGSVVNAHGGHVPRIVASANVWQLVSVALMLALYGWQVRGSAQRASFKRA